MSEADKRGFELDPVEREAVAWVQQLLSGHATIRDAEALRRWRAQSAAHSAAFARASRAWGDVGPAGSSLRQRGGAAGLSQFRTKPSAVSRRFILGGGLAAAAATYAMIEPPLGLWPSLSELKADYRTATGEQRSISLAGDVSVRMNSQTSLILKSSEPQQDRIELVAGEAAFSMVPEGQHTLVVLASNGRTSARGGRFDVRCVTRDGLEEVCVTSYSGDVRVEYQSKVLVLDPGQQARYDTSGLAQPVTIDPDSVSAWQRGIVVFNSTPLVDVVDEINRYRSGRIVLMNRALGQKLVDGRFRIDQMDKILLRLQEAFHTRMRTLPGGIVLLS